MLKQRLEEKELKYRKKKPLESVQGIPLEMEYLNKKKNSTKAIRFTVKDGTP